MLGPRSHGRSRPAPASGGRGLGAVPKVPATPMPLPAGVAQPSLTCCLGPFISAGVVLSGSHGDGSPASRAVLSWGFHISLISKKVPRPCYDLETGALVPHSAPVSHTSLLPSCPHLGAHGPALPSQKLDLTNIT